MAGKVPSEEIYPTIEQMLANALDWGKEQEEQRLAVSCEPLAVSDEQLASSDELLALSFEQVPA